MQESYITLQLHSYIAGQYSHWVHLVNPAMFSAASICSNVQCSRVQCPYIVAPPPPSCCLSIAILFGQPVCLCSPWGSGSLLESPHLDVSQNQRQHCHKNDIRTSKRRRNPSKILLKRITLVIHRRNLKKIPLGKILPLGGSSGT